MEFLDYDEAVQLLNEKLLPRSVKKLCEENGINYTSANEALNGKRKFPGIVEKLLLALGYKVEYKSIFQIHSGGDS